MIVRFMKRVDKACKMFIPKIATDMFGLDYYMEIYEDHIKLIPIKKGK